MSSDLARGMLAVPAGKHSAWMARNTPGQSCLATCVEKPLCIRTTLPEQPLRKQDGDSSDKISAQSCKNLWCFPADDPPGQAVCGSTGAERDLTQPLMGAIRITADKFFLPKPFWSPPLGIPVILYCHFICEW